MIEVFKNLYVGNDTDCRKIQFDIEWSVIHACKTCHQKALNYTKSLPSNHPNYLVFRQDRNLYLNLVDMSSIKLEFADPIFETDLKFILEVTGKVLIHCNQGISRSPAIALTYLANQNLISKGSFSFASKEFIKLYKNYNPGLGIKNYLDDRWEHLTGMNLVR